MKKDCLFTNEKLVTSKKRRIKFNISDKQGKFQDKLRKTSLNTNQYRIKRKYKRRLIMDDSSQSNANSSNMDLPQNMTNVTSRTFNAIEKNYDDQKKINIKYSISNENNQIYQQNRKRSRSNSLLSNDNKIETDNVIKRMHSNSSSNISNDLIIDLNNNTKSIRRKSNSVKSNEDKIENDTSLLNEASISNNQNKNTVDEFKKRKNGRSYSNNDQNDINILNKSLIENTNSSNSSIKLSGNTSFSSDGKNSIKLKSKSIVISNQNDFNAPESMIKKTKSISIINFFDKNLQKKEIKTNVKPVETKTHISSIPKQNVNMEISDLSTRNLVDNVGSSTVEPNNSSIEISPPKRKRGRPKSTSLQLIPYIPKSEDVKSIAETKSVRVKAKVDYLELEEPKITNPNNNEVKRKRGRPKSISSVDSVQIKIQKDDEEIEQYTLPRDERIIVLPVAKKGRPRKYYTAYFKNTNVDNLSKVSSDLNKPSEIEVIEEPTVANPSSDSNKDLSDRNVFEEFDKNKTPEKSHESPVKSEESTKKSSSPKNPTSPEPEIPDLRNSFIPTNKTEKRHFYSMKDKLRVIKLLNKYKSSSIVSQMTGINQNTVVLWQYSQSSLKKYAKRRPQNIKTKGKKSNKGDTDNEVIDVSEDQPEEDTGSTENSPQELIKSSSNTTEEAPKKSKYKCELPVYDTIPKVQLEMQELFALCETTKYSLHMLEKYMIKRLIDDAPDIPIVPKSSANQLEQRFFDYMQKEMNYLAQLSSNFIHLRKSTNGIPQCKITEYKELYKEAIKRLEIFNSNILKYTSRQRN